MKVYFLNKNSKKKNFFSEIIISAVYLALNAWLIYFMSQDRLFPVLNKYNVAAILLMFCSCTLFPTIGITILFRLKRSRNKSIVKAIVQIALIAAIPVLYIFGTFVTGEVVISRTENIKNYYMFDEEVVLSLEHDNYNILPKEIPKNAVNVQYEYIFFPTITPEFVIEVSWEYEDEDAFEKIVVESREKYWYLDTKTEVGNQINISKKRGDKCYIFSYDKEQKQVCFRITKNISV